MLDSMINNKERFQSCDWLVLLLFTASNAVCMSVPMLLPGRASHAEARFMKELEI
jgi:hypothetical protein